LKFDLRISAMCWWSRRSESRSLAMTQEMVTSSNLFLSFVLARRVRKIAALERNGAIAVRK
jgi:hypothetical protein